MHPSILLTCAQKTEPLDDVVAFLITIGSPVLAAYSLQITHLNKNWIAAAFLDVEYQNSGLIPTALAAFHNIPVKIEYSPPFLQSLVVLPKNDQYWPQLAAANKTRRWSIPLVMSYFLAIFSVILSMADSISSHSGNIGYAISSIWTFLLPLILGWLHVGCEPEPCHLRNSLAAANRNAWVATGKRDQPTRMTEPKAIEFARADDIDLARRDEYKPVPTFNYSRTFVTPMIAEVVLRLTKNASANARRHIPVKSTSGGEVTEWVESGGDEILSENRVGTTTEVTEYCTRVLYLSERTSRPVTPLDIQSTDTTNSTLLDDGLITPSRWAPGIWKRVTIASILALGLQWGTAGAAIFIHYLTPPAGLGCRSFAFLIYGITSTLSFFLFLASSILAHMCRPLPGQVPTRSRSRTYQNAGAIICRWLGKCVAIVSAIGILLVCFFQVTGAFDNCFCASTAFGRWGRQPVVFTGINFVPDSRTLSLWIGGLVAAFLTSILFGFSMYIGSPPRRY